MADQEKFLSFSDFFKLESVNRKLIDQLVWQLEKDLNTPIDRLSPQLLITQVEQVIEENHNNHKLQSLLYKIDISEADFAKALTQPKPVATLARMLVRREAQKVIFRNQYGSQD